LGFIDELKNMLQVKTFESAGYMILGGYVGGILGSVVGRYLKSDWGRWIGYLLGGAGSAYLVKKFLHNDSGAAHAMLGSIIFPLWEVVTDKIDPEELANKVSGALGMPWSQAITTTYAARPVRVEVVPVRATPAQPAPAEEVIKFEY